MPSPKPNPNKMPIFTPEQDFIVKPSTLPGQIGPGSTKGAELIPASPQNKKPLKTPLKAVKTDSPKKDQDVPDFPQKTVNKLKTKLPIGDVRFTANISAAHHRRLRLAGIEYGTTSGELVEWMIDKCFPTTKK